MGKKKSTSGIRSGAVRIEGYNEGLVVYLYDAANRQTIIEEKILDLVDAHFADPEAAAKGVQRSGNPLLVYELRQDDPICVEIVAGTPLNTKERKAPKGWKCLAPQTALLDLPSGKLCVESANSSRLNPDEPPMEPPGETLIPPGSYVVNLYRIEPDLDTEDDRATDSIPHEILTLTPVDEIARKPKPFLVLRHPSVYQKKKDVDVYEVRDNAFDGLAIFWEHWDYFALNLDQAALRNLGLEYGSLLEVEISKKKFLVVCLEGGAKLSPLDLAASAHLFDLQQLPGSLSGSPEIALGILNTIHFAERPVLWCLRIKTTDPATRQNKWIKASGRVLPERMELADQNAFDRWDMQNGRLHGEVIVQKPRQLFLNFPPEALQKIGAAQNSVLQIQLGAASLSARFLDDPATLADVLQQNSPFSTEDREEEWLKLNEQYYAKDENGKAKLRKKIRAFLTPDPANVAFFVDHWVFPDRKILMLQPIAGDWDDLGVMFDIDAECAPGDKAILDRL